jgi:hypothetical protein
MANETDKGVDASVKYLELQKACLKRQTLVQRQAKTLQRNLESTLKHIDILREMSERRHLQDQKRLIDSSIVIPTKEMKDEVKRKLQQHTRYFKSSFIDTDQKKSELDSMAVDKGKHTNYGALDLPAVDDSLRRFLELVPQRKNVPRQQTILTRPRMSSRRRLASSSSTLYSSTDSDSLTAGSMEDCSARQDRGRKYRRRRSQTIS